MPASVWFPLQRKPGIRRCAGASGEPSEKTSESVPISVIGPPEGAGLEEPYTGLQAP